MTAQPNKDRLGKILDSLKKASAGDYSTKLDFASKDDDLGLIADAVNKLLKKTEKKISTTQKSPDLTEDFQRYRHILDNIEESYFEVDLKGNLLFFNDTVIRDLGYGPEEIRGINFRELADETNIKKVYEAFHQVFTTGQPIKGFDWEILKKNKEKIDVEASVALLRDEKGKPVGFRGIVRNISQRVQVQKDLRESEEKYRTILDIMDEGYMETDLTGRVIFVNDATCRLMGYPREKLLGMHYHGFLTPAVGQNMKNLFNGVYNTGTPAQLVDYDLVRANGSVVTYEMNIALRDDLSGKPCAFRILMRDVSSRKKAEQAKRLSEEKYRHILENMEETYLETDLKGNFIFFNKSLCRLLGYSRDELQNANYRLISPPEQTNKIFKIFNEIYRTGQKRNFADHAIMTKDGSIIYLEMSISLMRSSAGEPIGFSGISRDVTSRLQAEQTIQNSERHLRLITDNIRDIIWTMDFDLRWTYLSPSVLPMTGFTPEEVMGMPLKAMLPPETYARMKETLSEELSKEARIPVPNERRTSTFEMPLLRKNGEPLHVEISVNFNRDEDGKPFEIVGVTRDISERRKAEEALRESEALYRKALETTSDGVSILQDGKYVYFNQQFLKTLNVPDQYPVGKALGTILHSDDIEKLKYFYEKRLRGEPTPGKHDLRVTRPDQTTMYLQVMSVDIVYNGKPALLNFMQDVTERKQAENILREREKRYRTMTENVNDIVWIIDFNLQITYASPSNIRVTGYTPEEVKNMALNDFITPDSLNFAMQVLSEELAREADGQPVDPNRSRTLQIEVYSKNGDNVWLEVNATFNRDASGGATEILAVGRNITERRNMEKALAESEQRYRMIVENMQDVICIMDLNFQFTYVSNDNLALTGYTKEEVKELPLDKLLPPNSLLLITDALSDALEQENSRKTFDDPVIRTMEIEIFHKAGGTTWAEVTATLTRDAQYKPAAILLVVKDITERKKIQEALKESEKRYRMIVENMHDSISIVDLNFNYIYQSPSEIRVTGYTPEEIMRIPIKDQMTPESYDYAGKKLAYELEREFSGEPVDPHRSISLEMEVYHKNGGTIWQELSAVFQRDENGMPLGIILASRDITAKKKAEDALAASERRYRLMAENVNDMIWIINKNLEFVYISPSNEEVTGYTPEETRRIPLSRLLTAESYARATQRLADELALEQSCRPFDPQRAITLEIEAIHKNGSSIYLEITGTFNRNDKGEITEILILGRDFTERRKAEQALAESEKRYRMIIENMHEVIWTTDLNLKTTYMSPSCFPLSGYTPEELMSLPIEQFMTPETLAITASVVMEEITSELSGASVDPYRSRTLEQEIIRKDGSTFWLEVTGSFIRDKQGKATGMLLAGRDITERKKAGEEKDKLEAQLMQAQKMEVVGRLAGGVAHDFNNMLSVILGYVDLAKLRLAKQHPVLHDIAEIEKAAIRSRDITTQLLAFSRKQIIEPKIIDLNDLIVHTQKAMIRLIGEDVDLKVIQGDTLSAIKVDPSQIEQILINLAVNARDAMPGGGKLTIETENHILDVRYCENHIGFTPGHYVRLSFSDNGVGMDKETLEHIFEPFFTTKEVGKGTGLGLATVYGIVKQNNGFINVYSEPGQGTTFSIYLPRTSEEKEFDDESIEEPEFAGQGNILLAEDDAMVLQITKGMLESIGYTVIAASNPLEAIALCENPDTYIDLVISDVIMPKMSGKELRNKLVEIRPGIKVIFMSGYTADVIAHHGVLEEGVMFLQKPFTLKSLAVKVDEALAAK